MISAKTKLVIVQKIEVRWILINTIIHYSFIKFREGWKNGDGLIIFFPFWITRFENGKNFRYFKGIWKTVTL